MEIDPDAADKLQVSRADFMHAFENDVKPVCFIERSFDEVMIGIL